MLSEVQLSFLTPARFKLKLLFILFKILAIIGFHFGYFFLEYAGDHFGYMNMNYSVMFTILMIWLIALRLISCHILHLVPYMLCCILHIYF